MRCVVAMAGLMLLGLAFVSADRAGANDEAPCAPSSGFVPKLCVDLPLAASAKREKGSSAPTFARLPAVARSHADVAPHIDVVIESGVTAGDPPPVVASEPQRAIPEARSAERVHDLADLRSYAWAAAVRQGIDPVLFLRQIAAESEFDPHAVSRAGAVGIAQIMPSLHPAVDPTDPYASLDYAARLMRGYINHFGDWRRALIAYNAGPGRLIPGNPYYLPQSTILSSSFAGGETMRYVARILGR